MSCGAVVESRLNSVYGGSLANKSDAIEWSCMQFVVANASSPIKDVGEEQSLAMAASKLEADPYRGCTVFADE